MDLQDAIALLKDHRERHGHAVTSFAPGLLSAPMQVAVMSLRHLLRPELVWHVEGLDVLAQLAGGDVLALGVNQMGDINGQARRDGQLRRASINEGAARAVFELAAGLWSNPAFLPHVQPTDGLVPLPEGELPVPRGMEYVAALSHSWEGTPQPQDGVPAPVWLAGGLQTLAGLRLQAFERTVWNAMRFLCLHELGHVCLGQLELGKRGQGYCAIDEWRAAQDLSRPRVSYLTDEVLRAFEIEADAYAAERLFAEAHERDAKAPQGVGLVSATGLALLGATLVPLIFHAMQVFSERPEPLSTHPPLWFRADAVMRAARPAVGADDALKQWARHDALLQLLMAVGQTHPLLGEWLAPVVDGGLDGPAQQVLKEAQFASRAFLRGRPRMRQEVIGPALA